MPVEDIFRLNEEVSLRDFIKLEVFGTKAQSIAPIGIVKSFFTFILKQKNIHIILY